MPILPNNRVAAHLERPEAKAATLKIADEEGRPADAH
jgi:hypothetical protein